MTTLFLIPSLLSDDNTANIPAEVVDAISKCSAVYAENIRTARRFFKAVCPSVIIDNIQWFEILKAEDDLLDAFPGIMKKNEFVGVVSEAGCPAIADPGYKLVALAHQLDDVKIVPLSGPSSIMMALMASGLGGNQFAFHGYLPIEAGQRKAGIQKIWKRATEDLATQLFMETPYRNNALFNTLIEVLPLTAKLGIACNISAKQEFIKTKTVKDWKSSPLPDLHKQPCIFSLGV